MPKKIKEKTWFNKFFVFTFCILSIGICIALADIFSSIIAVGGFNFTAGGINISPYNMYAISTGSSQSKPTAEEHAELLSSQGGAGYIFAYQNNYEILSSMYESEADAQKVKDKLTASNKNAKIIKISINGYNLSSSLSSDEKDIFTSAFAVFKNTYKGLYDTSVSLDTNVIEETKARLNINQIKSNISTTKSNFCTVFNQQNLLIFNKLKPCLDLLEQNVSALIENSQLTTHYSSLIKYEYIRTIFSYKDMIENIT